MLDAAEIKALAERKRLLVAESELNRQTFRLEAAQLREDIQGWPTRAGRSVLNLFGLYPGRSSVWSGLGGKLVWGWRFANVLKRTWRRFRRPQQPGPDTPD